MAKLDAAERKKIPGKEYGLPSERKYPVEDKAHEGRITKAQYDEICAKADAELGEKRGM